MDDLLSYGELIDLFPFISKLGVKKLNLRLLEKLQQKGMIEECKTHSPIFTKFAVIKDPAFELNQYGFKCRSCGLRLFPSQFVPFDFNKHCQEYREDDLGIKRPKTALEIAQDLVK